jgi:hypothetical protein
VTIRKYRPKPRQDTSTLTGAQYLHGESLDEVRKVAGMAYQGEAAECPLPSGTVLVAAWTDVPDDHPSRTRYTQVKPGEWLCHSSDYDSLTASSEGDLKYWYDL